MNALLVLIALTTLVPEYTMGELKAEENTKKKKKSKENSDETAPVVDKSDKTVIHKKKKDKHIEISTSIITEGNVKRKSKDKDQKINENLKRKVESEVGQEISVKKKKPFFRDKGEKAKPGSEETKSKFNISVKMGAEVENFGAPSVLKPAAAGRKGPKIIIAKEPKAEPAGKTKKLSKRNRKKKEV